MSDRRGIRRPLIITGSINADLQRLGVEWLESAGAEGTWIAAADRIASSRLLYQLLDRRASENRTLLGVERGSLFQCALRIALPRLVATSRVQATRLGVEAGVYRALRDLGQPLSELGEVVTARGLPGRLSATLRELRGQGVAEDVLESLPATGSDLGRILSRYREALSEARIVDDGDVYRAAISVLEGDQGPLPERLLAFDHPLASRIEVDFASALARAGVECVAVMLGADHRSLDRYRSAWPDADEQSSESPAGGASGLERLRQRLFVARAGDDPAPDDDSLQIFAAAGEDREAVEIVRRMQGLVERGTRYDRIGIVLRSPEIYQPVLEEAFSRAGVPAFFSRGSLRPDPAGRAFLALLGCRAEDYSATRFAEYLSLGQLPELRPETLAPWLASADTAVPAVNVDDHGQLTLDLGPPDSGPPPARIPEPQPAPSFPRRWERLLVEASVIGGYERWRRRIEGLEHELEVQLEHAQADDSTRARSVQARLDQVRNLKRFALPMIERLAGLPAEADVGDWIPALETLARRSLRHPRRVLSLLADLRPMAGVGSMRFAEMRRLLEQRLGDLRLDPEGSAYGKVFLGTPEEFRGLRFDSVFVCGLAEGIFPRKVREDPLLLDDARNQLDSGLATNDDRVDMERLRLQTAAAAAESRLLASYPTWDALTGRARVPSFYAFDTVAAGYGRLEPLTEVSSRSPVRADPNLAIDAAEFDVASLLPKLHSTELEPGSCSYLLATNRHLKRSLRTRGRRWLNFLSPADGLVDPDDNTLELLARYRLRGHPYSPTTLQHYAACPYRFFLHGVLRLRPREEAEDLEQLDPLTRGSVYHAIQFRFLRTLAEEDRLRFDSEHQDDLLERLDQAIEAVSGEYADRLRPALPAVYQGEIEELRTDLRGWLRQLVAEPDFTPSHFELSFGLPTDREHDPASSADPVMILDSLLAKGSIDMVERSPTGTYRVTDHKTGKPWDTRNLTVGGGEALQPLIYAYAAAGLLDAEVGEGRLWYSTRRGRYSSLKVPTGEYQRHSLATVTATADSAVEKGLLPAAPREGACSFCDYRPVCGPHEELRIDIKMRNPQTRERLEDLSHVRKME